MIYLKYNDCENAHACAIQMQMMSYNLFHLFIYQCLYIFQLNSFMCAQTYNCLSSLILFIYSTRRNFLCTQTHTHTYFIWMHMPHHTTKPLQHTHTHTQYKLDVAIIVNLNNFQLFIIISFATNTHTYNICLHKYQPLPQTTFSNSNKLYKIFCFQLKIIDFYLNGWKQKNTSIRK